MKILFVDCSPKSRWSTSSYLLSQVSFQIRGEKEKIKLLPKNYAAICEKMKKSDAVVLAMPIYVDGVPASVLRFFEYVQGLCERESFPEVKIYAVVNCGFYEGRQTKTCHSMIQNWCRSCGFSYEGGIGQGAGEMIGIIRFVNPFLAVALTLIQLVINAILHAEKFIFSEALLKIALINISVNMAIFLIFNIFMYIAVSRLARAIRNSSSAPLLYSTVFCPRFLFVIFADLFWIIKALLRGVPVWRLKEKPAGRAKAR